MAPYPRWFQTSSPLRGPFLAVEWSTRRYGTHLALGATPAALLRVWQAVVEDWSPVDDFTFKTWRLEFLDVPEELAAHFDEQVFWEAAESVQYHVAAASFGASCYGPAPKRPKTGEWPSMPAQFKTCDAFRPRSKHSGKADPRNPMQSHHDSCQTCAWGLLWVGVDPTPEAQREAWRQALLQPALLPCVASQVRPPARERRSPRPGPDPTHVLLDDFGHHHDGLVMEEIAGWQPSPGRRVVSFVRAEPANLAGVRELRARKLRANKQDRLEEQRRWDQEKRDQNAAEAERDERILVTFLDARGRADLRGRLEQWLRDPHSDSLLLAHRLGEYRREYRNLQLACAALLRSFVRDRLTGGPAADPRYVSRLLDVARHICAAETSVLFPLLAEQPGLLQSLPPQAGSCILEGISAAGIAMPPGFWVDLFWACAPLRAPALRGVLASSPEVAPRLLPFVPDPQGDEVAQVIAAGMERADLWREVGRVLPRCQPGVREAVGAKLQALDGERGRLLGLLAQRPG